MCTPSLIIFTAFRIKQLTSDWPRAGMFPGATAPSAHPGYSTVQIVPGLTAVLPPGFVVPPFTVVAGVTLVPPCHWFTLSGACLLHALIMGSPVPAACIALLSVGLPSSISAYVTVTFFSQHRKPFATSLCILLQAFSCMYIAVLAICIGRLSFILHRMCMAPTSGNSMSSPPMQSACLQCLFHCHSDC